MKDDKTLVLTEKWITAATDAPTARSLEMVEIMEDNYMHKPFPISLDGQKRLLELIYNRKSGIITRQELIDILFSPDFTPKGTIIKSLI